MAYYQIEPWGERPKWLRTGILASILVNIFRKKGSRSFKPEDFMPKESEITKPKMQTVEEQKKMLMGIFDWAKKKGKTKKTV